MHLCNFYNQTYINVLFEGAVGRITIATGKTMKVIGTVTGPIKKYVGKQRRHFIT